MILEKPGIEALRRALELMNEEGRHWTKGSYHRVLDNDEDAYCSMGAFYHVHREMGLDVGDAIDALAHVIPNPNEYPFREAHDIVVAWNDDPATNFTKVRAAFLAAEKFIKKQPVTA